MSDRNDRTERNQDGSLASYHELLSGHRNKKLPGGVISEVAALFMFLTRRCNEFGDKECEEALLRIFLAVFVRTRDKMWMKETRYLGYMVSSQINTTKSTISFMPNCHVNAYSKVYFT